MLYGKFKAMGRTPPSFAFAHSHANALSLLKLLYCASLFNSPTLRHSVLLLLNRHFIFLVHPAAFSSHSLLLFNSIPVYSCAAWDLLPVKYTFYTYLPGFVVSVPRLVRFKIQSGSCCQTNFAFLFIF